MAATRCCSQRSSAINVPVKTAYGFPVRQSHLASRLPPSKLASSARSAQKFDSLKANALVYESTLSVEGMQVTSPKAWGIIASKLKEANVKVISQQELLFAKEKGAVILDIRPSGEFENGHISESQNVALFRLITGWNLVKILRRAGFAFFGVFNGTEANPDFEAEVTKIIELGGFEGGKQTPLVVLCHSGGSLDPTQNQKNGKQSRSLIAAYELLKLGFTKVSVLKGGFSEWKRNDRAFEVLE